MGRATQGVTLIAVDEGTTLTGVQRVVERDAAENGHEGDGGDAASSADGGDGDVGSGGAPGADGPQADGA
jgi:DNA gyrase subunit A